MYITVDLKPPFLAHLQVLPTKEQPAVEAAAGQRGSVLRTQHTRSLPLSASLPTIPALRFPVFRTVAPRQSRPTITLITVSAL
mmetsp:Transcript_19567/g.54421  ORF Transcript_19567/g.54421 Transcript_19567/m.54421 type:complete len:83 (-) Transcript_19567:106-354(-)